MQSYDSDLSTPVTGPPSSDWLAPAPLAPAWHTIVLIAGVALLAVAGAKQLSPQHAQVNKLQTYAFTVATDLLLLAWVYLGFRLRRIPFRSIFGEDSPRSKSLGIDLLSAVVFWFGSLMVMGSINLTWMAIEAALHHQQLFPNGQPPPGQQKLFNALSRIAPAHPIEIAAWIGVCVMAGLTEEIVFRGYLQRQFTAWQRRVSASPRTAIAVGVVLSALAFGSAHLYQGGRQMILLSIFGALFSGLTIFRRNIRAGIIAHAWQDIFAGLMLALAHAMHRL